MMPVLWSRIPENEWHNHESYNPPHEKGNRSFISAINQLHIFAFQGNYNRQDVHQPDDCSLHPGQTVIVPHEEQKKKWRDLGDDRKKQLKVQISLSFSIRPLTTPPDWWRAFGRYRHY
jgi:hypothetical protein